MAVHQIMSGIAKGDAVSSQALLIQDILRKSGQQSEIYSVSIDPRIGWSAHPLSELTPSPEDTLIHQFCIGSTAFEFIQNAQCRKKIMFFHNITPANFFRKYDYSFFKDCALGREQLKEGYDLYDEVYGDSEYNCDELRQLGYQEVEKIPIYINTSEFRRPLNYSLLSSLKRKRGSKIIFVGRVAPNKRQDELIRIFSYYQNFFDNNSHLYIIGSNREGDFYYEQLKKLVGLLKVKNVHFTGHIPQEDILTYYEAADAFLCASEHEGFCIPLVEAMFFKVPILAKTTSAIPETLGAGGILYSGNNYHEIAAMLWEIVSSKDLSKKIQVGQEEQLKKFRESVVLPILTNALIEKD